MSGGYWVRYWGITNTHGYLLLAYIYIHALGESISLTAWQLGTILVIHATPGQIRPVIPR